MVVPLEEAPAPLTAAPAATSAPPFAHDGTERRIIRPQDPAEQAACYSGKKAVSNAAKDHIRLWKKGIRDLVMELCCALHNFRVRMTPWQPMV